MILRLSAIHRRVLPYRSAHQDESTLYRLDRLTQLYYCSANCIEVPRQTSYLVGLWGTEQGIDHDVQWILFVDTVEEVMTVGIRLDTFSADNPTFLPTHT
jgi:hypothetical protein